MTTFYLVRHTHYDNPLNILPGRLPVKLSTQGMQEAERLKKYFSDKNIQKIYSSEVLRCKQTSEIMANGNIPIEFDTRLLEVLSAYQGYWTYDWNVFFRDQPILGGEDKKSVQDRMVDFMLNTVFEDNASYIICSHGDPLYFFYQYVNNMPMIVEAEEAVQPHDYQLKGSIRIFTRENGKWESGKTIQN